MNHHTVPWDVLATKAQGDLTARQKKWVDARQNQAQLQSSMQRMTALYEEYRQQESSHAAQEWDAQVRLNHRQFMAQLLRVQDRLRRELGLADLAVERAAQAMSQAELQLQKVSTLQGQQTQRQRKEHADKEQRRIDELAIMRFGARATH